MSDSRPPVAVEEEERAEVLEAEPADLCEQMLTKVLGGAHDPGLPPGTVRLPSGSLVRAILHSATDKGDWVQVRVVSLDLEEARKQRTDFYDPVLGWILEGYKLAKDRSVEDIMSDTTTPTPKLPD